MLKTTRFVSFGVVVGLLLLPAVAVADVVDPDAYADGTVLNTAYAGVTLSTVSGVGGGSSNVYARRSTNNSTPPNVFGNDTYLPYEWALDGHPGTPWGALRADFAAGATSVSIDCIGNNSYDLGTLHAFDSGGVLLASSTTGVLTSGVVETLSISGVGNIAYILVGGLAASGETVYLDNLNYTPVPVPGGLALGVLGLAGVAALRRKKRRLA